MSAPKTPERKNPLRPEITPVEVRHLVEDVYGLQVTNIKELISYIDRNFFVTVEDSWDNKYIQQLWPHGYVLKVLNSRDSVLTKHVDAQHDMMDILNRGGLCCPKPVRNKQGHLTSHERPPWTHASTIQNGTASNLFNETEKQPYHLCRLLTYSPGETIHSVTYTDSLMYQAGYYLARMQRVLREFQDQSLTEVDFLWRMDNLSRMRKYLHAVKNADHRKLALTVIAAFESEVVPHLDGLCKGAIHGDFNDYNIIVKERTVDEQDTDTVIQGCTAPVYDISAVIDFGDATYTCFVFDLAILMMYMCIGSSGSDYLEVGRHVLRGYQTIRPLTPAERSVLKYCVAARYTQSVVMGEYSYSQEPDNDYLRVTVDKGWPQLNTLWNTSTNDLHKIWSID